MIERHAYVVACAMLSGCSGGNGSADDPASASDSDSAEAGSASEGDPTAGDDSAETGAPEPEGEGPAEFPAGRRIRRMTADQYMRSLEIATGQTWPDYAEFAPALGKADYAEIVSEDRALSVTFDKFIHDAALSTCRAAVDADVEQGTGVILRDVAIDSDDEAFIRANLVYLTLRFLASDVQPSDPRLDVWVDLVADTSLDDDARRERWVAVCVGFATHPDFVAY
jgi:hypothetical protein